MGIYAIKPAFQRSLRPVEDLLVEWRVSPDAITAGALGLSAAGGAALAFSAQEPLLLLAAPVAAMGRTALNALDGLVAKRTRTARAWGEVLNEFSDRLADMVLLGGLALAGLAPGLVAASAIVAVLLGSYLGVLSKAAGGPRQYGGVMGKADRMVLLAVAAPMALIFDAEVVITAFFAAVVAGAVVTIIQRGVKTHGDL
jgi:phosphatidylglycerophosphate synthase